MGWRWGYDEGLVKCCVRVYPCVSVYVYDRACVGVRCQYGSGGFVLVVWHGRRGVHDLEKAVSQLEKASRLRGALEACTGA